MKSLLKLGVCLFLLSCGPATATDGSGGAGATNAGGADGGTAASGGASTGGNSGGTAGSADGGAASGGGNSTGGSGQSSGGQSNGSGGASVEPGSALERFLAAGEPRVVYLQTVLGTAEDLDASYNPEMLSADGACDRTFVGGCALTEGCTFAGEIPRLDAGTITLASPGAGDPLVANLTDGRYTYSGGGFFDVPLAGGEPLILSGAGGVDLPAFELETTFPLVIIIDNPTGDLTAPIAVSTTADLTLEFRRATESVILLVDGVAGTGDSTREILCAGAGDPGTLVVPAEALAHLGPGVELTLYTTAIESVDAGDRTVNFIMLTGTSNDERENLFRLVTQ